MKRLELTLLALLLFSSHLVIGQDEPEAVNKGLTYSTVFDDPYNLNQFWINFSPMTVDIGSSNVVFTPRIEGRFQLGEKMEAYTSLHASYGPRLDLNKWAGTNSNCFYLPDESRTGKFKISYQNFRPSNYLSFEGGLRYFLKDEEQVGESKITMATKRFKATDLGAKPYIKVKSKVRIVQMIRVGYLYQQSAVNVSNALYNQNKSIRSSDNWISDKNGKTIVPNTGLKAKETNQLFSNFTSAALYLGYGHRAVRNITVKAEKFGNLANNIILDYYADLAFAPWQTLENLSIQIPGKTSTINFNANQINLSNLGWRAGFDVSYNQDVRFSFGAELGMRPSIAGQQGYFIGKLNLPALSFKYRKARVASSSDDILK